MGYKFLLFYAIGVLIAFIVIVFQSIRAFKETKLEVGSKFESISLHTIFIVIVLSLFSWLSWLAIVGFLIEYIDKKKK